VIDLFKLKLYFKIPRHFNLLYNLYCCHLVKCKS